MKSCELGAVPDAAPDAPPGDRYRPEMVTADGPTIEDGAELDSFGASANAPKPTDDNHLYQPLKWRGTRSRDLMSQTTRNNESEITEEN